jgi:hypothetical protein
MIALYHLDLGFMGAPVSPQARDLAQSPPVRKTSGDAELKTLFWALMMKEWRDRGDTIAPDKKSISHARSGENNFGLFILFILISMPKCS